MKKENLVDFTLAELKEIAKEKKIIGYSKLSKTELIENIENVCFRIPYEPFDKEDAFIENFYCEELPIKNIKYILGPYIFYKFILGNRQLYLFGEFHQKLSNSLKELKQSDAKKGNTLLFSSFVHSLALQNPKKKYDLMIELSGAFDNNFENWDESAMFNNLQTQFLKCITKEKKYCPYENLRVHYVDYRDALDETGTPYIDSKKPFHVLLKEFLKFGKVYKQISNIKDATIRKQFTQFFVDYATKDTKRANAVKMAVMDIYAMSRMLRDFSHVKRTAKAFTGTGENIIYYAGADHIHVMVKFLTKYLHLKPIFKTGFCEKEKLIHNKPCLSFVELDLKKHPHLF